MQIREKKYEKTHQLLRQLGLEERTIEVYIHCYEKGDTDIVEVSKELEMPQKKLKKTLITLQKTKLIELTKIKHNLAIKTKSPLPILMSLVNFIEGSIERLQDHFPKALENQLKIVEQDEDQKYHIKEFENYLHKTRKGMPAIIEKEYQRYHRLLAEAKIFQEIKECVLELKNTFQSIEEIIAQEMGYEKSFLEKTTEKVEKAFKEEFEVEELVEFSSQLFKELFREHFKKLTEAYTDRLKIITRNLTGDLVNRLEELTEVADQASVDLDIAFMAIKTGMEAILSDFDKRINQVHTEIDTKIDGLKTSFKKALHQSFHEGAMKKILDFLELAKKSLRELQNIS